MCAKTSRWSLCSLLFCATVLSYLDRQTLAIAAPVIAKEFSLNNAGLAGILSAFVFPYTVGQLLAGPFFDRIGTRKGFAICVGVWSAANTLTAWAVRPLQFSVLRVLLGAGESGNFTGGVKAVAESFTVIERPVANGLFSSGASVGALIAGPLIGTVTHYYGWRAAFFLTGMLGFFWLAAWLFFYSPPEQCPSIDERANAEKLDGVSGSFHWLALFKRREVWALFLGRLLEEPVIWISLFWLPKYLVDMRGLPLQQAGWLLAVPFVALDAGYLMGGLLSALLIRRGWGNRRSKRIVMTFAALLMTADVIASFAANLAAFAILISIATLGHGAWFSNLMSFPSDFVPERLVASVYGISAVGGGLSGIVVTEITGIVADRFHSFTPVFIAVGVLPVVGTALMFGLARQLRGDSPLG